MTCYDTFGIYHNKCLQVWLKVVGQFLRHLPKRDFYLPCQEVGMAGNVLMSITLNGVCTVRSGVQYLSVFLSATAWQYLVVTHSASLTQNWSFQALALWTTYTNWHQNWFMFSKYCVHKFGNRQTNGHTHTHRRRIKEVKNTMSLPSSLARWRHNLYINRGTYVPASVCRGKATGGKAALLGPRLAAGHAVAKPRTHGEAAYNLVSF